MREVGVRSSAMAVDADSVFARARVGRIIGQWRVLVRRPADTAGALVAAVLVTGILVNALHLQVGAHPSPLVAKRSNPAPRETTGSLTLVQEQPATPAPASARGEATRTQAQLLTEIQRELARRNFYDGAIDGIHGPKMEAAIRAFERAAGKRQTGEANEALLDAVKRSTLKAPAPRRAETPAAAPTRRIAAVQKALSDYGYGQVRQSGVMDGATKAAIEKFERDRKLPVKGQLSDRVLRELASATGRRFE